MKSLTIKHFRYFLALAEERHFGRAAQSCAISQPALSLQIKELEALLGASLVERKGRDVLLTGVGQEFARRAAEIVRAIDDIGALIRASREDLSGPFRLGVIPTVAPYLLPDVAKRIAGAHPALELVIRESITAKLVDAILGGAIDAAVVALPISDLSLIETPLFTEEFVLVRALADRDAPVPNAEDLQMMKLLLLEDGHCFRDQALSFCGAGRSKSRNIMDGSSLSTLVQMVSAGIGVTLIPEMAIALETRATPVAIARFPERPPQRTVGMIWRKTNPMERQLIQLSELVRAAATESTIGSKIEKNR